MVILGLNDDSWHTAQNIGRRTEWFINWCGYWSAWKSILF